MADLTDIDYELLSAYLDEMLSADERAALEARLLAEPTLRAALDDLRVVQQAVASLPVMPAPRDFRLTHDMIEPVLLMAAPPMDDVPPAADVPLPPSAPAKVTPLPRRTPWWAAAAAAVTLLIAGGGLFLLSNRAPEPPPLMIAAAPTELASPTSDDVANATLILPMSTLPAQPTLPPAPAAGMRQLEATPEPLEPMALQAAPPSGAATEEVLELAPMSAAESAPVDAAGDTADVPMMAFAAPADALPSVSPQALVDGLNALLRLLLQLALGN